MLLNENKNLQIELEKINGQKRQLENSAKQELQKMQEER